MDRSLEYDALNMFVGRWRTDGKILATTSNAEIAVFGTDSYEWLPGKFFLLHKVDVMVGEERNETIEIIGYDKQNRKFTLQHYDNKGNSGFMNGFYNNGIWTFVGETLRFNGAFKEADKEFSGIWEQSIDGNSWLHFMDIRLKKLE